VRHLNVVHCRAHLIVGDHAHGLMHLPHSARSRCGQQLAGGGQRIGQHDAVPEVPLRQLQHPSTVNSSSVLCSGLSPSAAVRTRQTRPESASLTHPPKIKGCKLGSCGRMLDEIRIYKYTYLNHKLGALNIKYYNFSSSFDTTKFCSGKLHLDAEVIHSMIQGQHLTLRCRPQKRSMPSSLPARGPTVMSGPFTHRKEEENYMHIVRSTRQSLSN
jgi:hypothetical protein